VGIDEYITTKLPKVATGFLNSAAATKNEFYVVPDRCWTVDRPPIGSFHTVRFVELTISVDQKWPRQFCLFDVGSGHEVGVEGYNNDVHPEFLDTVILLTQLRKVFATRQSSQMAMENNQQPSTGKVIKPVSHTVDVAEFERCCGFCFHESFCG